MRLIEHFFRLIAPANCVACGIEGSFLCVWCAETALPEPDSRCFVCNKLTSFGAVCATCRRKTPLRHLWPRTEYSESAKQIIHSMKFSYSVEAADLIALELANTIPALPKDTIIIHVPAASTHVRERGFDHAARIARGISRHTGFDWLPALSRTGQDRQVGAGRKQRLSQMDGAFVVHNPQTIKEARILLVDDVVTTGATIKAAAKVLKEAGAKSVDAVVFARVK